MTRESFALLDPGDPSPRRRNALDARVVPKTLTSHAEAARFFQPDPDLVDAINVALAVGAPLLLTGEAGTGKTQVAHYVAWYFGVPLYSLFVRSTTTAEELLYSFDAVAYLNAANDPAIDRGDLTKEPYIDRGALWRAYEEDGTSVVLIDEIDKAPRDFPNDLLHVLDQHSFAVPELDKTVSRGERPLPVVVITSNSERRLPEPFLRRCVFHHIAFDDDLVRRAVKARAGDFPHLDEDVRAAALERFLDLRRRDLRKKPATAELLVWLTLLSARGDVRVEDVGESVPASELPAIQALVKDRDDLALLG